MPAAQSAHTTNPDTLTTPTTDDSTRLYISPFDASLSSTLLGPSLAATVTASSFHTLPTFPDKPFGYVTLPSASALALRQKLNGAHLRGHKMKVEEARAEKKRKLPSREKSDADAGEGVQKKREKKRAKLEEGVLPAVEVSEGRSVKRGWAGGEETKVRKDGKGGKDGKSKDKGAAIVRVRKPGEMSMEGKADTPKKGSRRTEVKEFEKTTSFPSFLRDKTGASKEEEASEFVEGKGWVDSQGKVVEAVTNRRSTRRKTSADAEDDAVRTPVRRGPAAESSQMEVDSDAESSASSVVSSSISSDSSEGEPGDKKEEDTSASPTTSTSTPVLRKALSKSPIIPSTEPATPAATNLTTRGKSTRSPTSTEKPIHPLEALFKRPTLPLDSTNVTAPTSAPTGQTKSRPSPINTSFSFGFASDAGSVDGEAIDGDGGTAYPSTPYTRQDLDDRRARSAAPTPDTAAIGRRFSWRGIGGLGMEDDDDDGDEEEGGEGQSAVGAENVANVGEEGAEDDQAKSGAQEEQTAFEKHFYEHRGEYNRAWKQRKREARKEVRQTENRRVGVGR